MSSLDALNRARVVLWHVPISHYSEKARWALDFKRVPHARRRLVGGVHPLVAYVLTRGQHDTVPVLTIGGRAIGDSTAIIRELEARFPDPPLYPRDGARRRRALELEDFFDEELGPFIRRLGYHDVLSDPAAVAELTRLLAPAVPARGQAVAEAALPRLLDFRFGVLSEEGAQVAEGKVRLALDRLEAELDGREHLCGDAFSVADLTAASLFYPLVLPREGPWRPHTVPAAWERRRRALGHERAAEWIARTYARHRRPDPALPPPAPAPE